MKSPFIDRKAQSFTIQSIGTIAIALLVVAVIMTINTTILEKIKKTTDDDSSNFGNTTLTWVANNTPMALDTNARLTGGGSVFNGTGTGNLIPAAFWSINISDDSIKLLNVTNQTWSTADLVADPDVFIGSTARNITSFGVDGQLQMAEFIPTIAIIAIAAVLIGIVMVMFGRRKLVV